MKPDPIPYSVRASTRARHVRLTVTARDGLVVVVPAGVHIDAEALVENKRAWALRTLAAVAPKRELYLAGPAAMLPGQVFLGMEGVELLVRYEPVGTARATRRGDELVITGGEDASQRLAALQRWLDRYAHRALAERTDKLAHRHGLSYSAIRITGTRSRWGSCSARGTISLNRTLVLLPVELCDAVIVHELAHTKVLNHSPRFWSLLESLDPDARTHRARLKGAAALIPAWADA